MIQKPELLQFDSGADVNLVDQVAHAASRLSGSPRSCILAMTGLSPPLHSYLGLGSLIDISSEEWLTDDFESEEVRGQTCSLILKFMSCQLHPERSTAPLKAFVRSYLYLLY